VNTPPDETIQPQPWLAVPRGPREIRLIVLHSTRGPTTQDRQYEATKNTLLSEGNNQGGWGSSTNRIISHEGQMCVCWPDDMSPTYSCGFGFNFSDWAVDWHAISFELAQSTLTEDFAAPTIDRAVKEVALLCRKYDIPPVWLDHVDQTGAVPRGITGHENTDNGRRYQKSDPGSLDRGGRFDTAAFIARVRAEMGLPPVPGAADTPVTPPTPIRPQEPPQPPAPPPLGTDRIHVVVDDETLWRIATDYYGDGQRWRDILEANEGLLHGEARNLAEGMRIKIP
jgi:hypothetical protein